MEIKRHCMNNTIWVILNISQCQSCWWEQQTNMSICPSYFHMSTQSTIANFDQILITDDAVNSQSNLILLLNWCSLIIIYPKLCKIYIALSKMDLIVSWVDHLALNYFLWTSFIYRVSQKKWWQDFLWHHASLYAYYVDRLPSKILPPFFCDTLYMA